MALDAPNYTQFPNAILDKLATMSNSEFRIVAVAARLTFGWHKTSEAISVSQFAKHSGLSRQGALNGIQEALAHGYLVEVGTGKRGVKIYQLQVADQSTTLTSEPADQSTTLTSEDRDWSSTLTSEPADQSTTLTRTSQRRVPTKERKEKNNIKEKELPKPSPAVVQEKLQNEQPEVVVDGVDENHFQKNWQSAFKQMEIQFDRGNFDTWLRDLEFMRCETPPAGSEAPPSPVYVIGGARTQIQIDMLQNRLYRSIRRIVSDVHGSPVELRFEINNPPKLQDHPGLKALIEGDASPVEPAEAIRAARQAEVERLYTAYIGRPEPKNREALGLLARDFSVQNIEEAFKNAQLQGSLGKVRDPLGYAIGILRRM